MTDHGHSWICFWLFMIWASSVFDATTHGQKRIIDSIERIETVLRAAK